MDGNIAQEYESVTPCGHTIKGNYNPINEQFECHLYHKENGNKIALSEEIAAGITAAMRADAVAIDAEANEDDWSKTIHELKLKQSQYLRELAGAAADIIASRVN